MFLKESMRVHTPVPAIGRLFEKPLEVKSSLNAPQARTIPEKTTTILTIFSLHRNETLWENPEVRSHKYLHLLGKIIIFCFYLRFPIMFGNGEGFSCLITSKYFNRFCLRMFKAYLKAIFRVLLFFKDRLRPSDEKLSFLCREKFYQSFRNA